MYKLFGNKGFSLLEASIVMGVVSVGILGVFSLVLQNIQVQKVNKNILVASMLAQEGLELARNIRDDNWIASPAVAWDLDIAGLGAIDYMMNLGAANDGDSDGDITEEANTRLYINGAGFYTFLSVGNTKTMYSRLITADGVDASMDGVIDYYKVTSHVQWQGRDGLKDYIAETHLYNWR